jgi:hypothetical protein
MSKVLTQLSVQKLDFHYHAGLERPNQLSLRDYVQHASDTGRRCQGITDHVDLFMRPSQWDLNHAYPNTLEGMWQLRNEVHALREDFPHMKLFFAPEYNVATALSEIGDAWLEAADICLFELVYESWQVHTLEERSEVAVRMLHQMGDLAQRIGKPCYWVHPLRGIICRWIYDPVEIHPMVKKILHHSNGHVDAENLNQMFQFDLAALGKAAAEAGVPLEANGMSQYRLRARLPRAYAAYIEAYEMMLAQGARFVPGTDQHNPGEYPNVVGWTEPFDLLGSEALDTHFCQQVGIEIIAQ